MTLSSAMTPDRSRLTPLLVHAAFGTVRLAYRIGEAKEDSQKEPRDHGEQHGIPRTKRDVEGHVVRLDPPRQRRREEDNRRDDQGERQNVPVNKRQPMFSDVTSRVVERPYA